jgi:flavin reductase (DIM6/NTAB) family NADH-FMN oxidoreductase RutF
MQRIDYLSVAEKALRQIASGAFLTVQAGDHLNVMTFGWASIGFVWGRPMFTVLVRKSRYTFELIERTSTFSASVPLVDMKKELEICGSLSGRTVDKLKKCRLEILPGEKIKTPVLDIPGIHFECEIVYKSPIDPHQLAESYTHLYPEKDYHTMYYGEIVHCFSTAHD